jgi:hypothetical protein
MKGISFIGLVYIIVTRGARFATVPVAEAGVYRSGVVPL